MGEDHTKELERRAGDHEEPHVSGLGLFGRAALWQDWNREATDSESTYWELFTDLILVATAAAVADIFKTNISSQGMYEFATVYTILISGWLLYTHHYSSRFCEPSLTHKFVLFFFLLGMAVSIVNANYNMARPFSIGILIQRGSYLCMLVPIAVEMERARKHVVPMIAYVAITMVGFAITIVVPDWAPIVWPCIAALDFSSEALMLFIKKEDLIPINVPHSTERLNTLMLIMLGEAIISATKTYRLYLNEDDNKPSSRYYVVLGLSFLLIFTFTLLIFEVEPMKDFHAFKRSRAVATAYCMINIAVGSSLLLIGICIKLAIEAVAARKDWHPQASNVLGYSVGITLLLLFAMRSCHYLGRLPRPDDPPFVQRLMAIWRMFFVVFSLLPFLLANMFKSIEGSLCAYGVLTTIMCVVDVCFGNVLDSHMPRKSSGADSAESSSLLSSQRANAC